MKIMRTVFLLFILYSFLFLGWAVTLPDASASSEETANSGGELVNENETISETNPDYLKWQEIEEYLSRIANTELKTIDQFYLYGYEPGYERVPTQSFGYLPFFENKEMEIIMNMVPESNTVVRPNIMRTTTKYIVIHNTGAANPLATAKRISQSLINSTRQASWHFTVDDYETYQQLQKGEIGWHAGTKEGNNYSVGIEMAVYKGIDFDTAMRRTAKLTADLLLEFDLGIDDVKQHFDFSGKNCPQVIRESDRWTEFLNLVEIEYYGQKNFPDVSFVWNSLSSDIMNDQGKLIKNVPSKTALSYQVTVTYNNRNQVFTFSSSVK